MQKEKLRGLLTGIAIGCIITCGAAIAKEAVETINVTYKDIKIVVDGEEIEPKDANGTRVEPFIYQGTTYLPVRAVGQAIGKDVAWDGVEKVVYLGAKPGETENWLSECGPYQYFGECTEYRLTENQHFAMSGKKYTNGFTMGKDSNWYNAPFSAMFNLDGKYNSVSFTVGHVDGSAGVNRTMNVYLDGIIAYTKELKYDDVAQKVTIPLNGALQMKIEMTKEKSQDYGVAIYGFSEGKFE